MAQFLGTEVVDVFEHPKYGQYTPSDWAMLFIERYGSIQGDHHRAWVLDQVARILKGTLVEVTLAKWDNGESEYWFETVEPPSQEYLNWVEEMLGATDEYGEREYDYDYGIPP